MIEATDDRLSLERILFEQEGAEGLEAAMRERGADDAVDERLGVVAPGLRSVTRGEVVNLVADILDLSLVDVLAAGWQQWDQLAEAARRTLQTPGETEIVELVDHEITSTHRPEVEIVVDGMDVAHIDVLIEVEIHLHALTAVVTEGTLSALRSGRADVSAELVVEGVKVAEKTRRIELPIEVSIGAGIPLVMPEHLPPPP